MNNFKHFGIRINNSLHYKIKHIAKYEKRSVSSQILYIISNYICSFEKENGKIIIDKETYFI